MYRKHLEKLQKQDPDVKYIMDVTEEKADWLHKGREKKSLVSLPKVIAFNGSLRKKWNTATLLEMALEGAASQGAKTEPL